MNFVSRALAVALFTALLARCAGSQEQASQDEFTIVPTKSGEFTALHG